MEEMPFDIKKSASLTGYHILDVFLEDCFKTMRAKGHDYREGNDDDLIHNFRTVGDDVGLPMEKVWYIYCSKHWKALKTFIKEGGQSESEPIEQRIKDIIVYMLLFYVITKEMKARKIDDKHLTQSIKELYDEINSKYGIAAEAGSLEPTEPDLSERPTGDYRLPCGCFGKCQGHQEDGTCAVSKLEGL